jgi:hypothetical protein
LIAEAREVEPLVRGSSERAECDGKQQREREAHCHLLRHVRITAAAAAAAAAVNIDTNIRKGHLDADSGRDALQGVDHRQ